MELQINQLTLISSNKLTQHGERASFISLFVPERLVEHARHGEVPALRILDQHGQADKLPHGPQVPGETVGTFQHLR